MDLSVTKTSTTTRKPPPARCEDNTATRGGTGQLVVLFHPFVNEGDKIRVDTPKAARPARRIRIVFILFGFVVAACEQAGS